MNLRVLATILSIKEAHLQPLLQWQLSVVVVDHAIAFYIHKSTECVETSRRLAE